LKAGLIFDKRPVINASESSEENIDFDKNRVSPQKTLLQVGL